MKRNHNFVDERKKKKARQDKLKKRKRDEQEELGKPKKRGWTLPGYNFIGPGNSLNNGIPTDNDDEIANVHDWDYKDIEDSGQDPYWKWSNADDEAMEEFGYGWGGHAGKAAFRTKKFAHKAGLLDKIDEERVFHHKRYDHY